MELNCQFGPLYSDCELLYTCHVHKAFITEKDHEIKKFKGVHVAEFCSIDVQAVWFNFTNIKHLPRGLENHFPNLVHLFINGGGIKKISKNDLKGFERLVGLHIRNVQLTSLPDDLLTEMPNLQKVSFRGNKIKFASSEFLKPLLGRENVKVDLRLNKHIDACYWPELDDSLESLEELMKLIDEKCIKPTPSTVEQDAEEPALPVVQSEVHSEPAPSTVEQDAEEQALPSVHSEVHSDPAPSTVEQDAEEQALPIVQSEVHSEPALPTVQSEVHSESALPTMVPDFVEFNPKIKDQWVSGRLTEMKKLRKVPFNEDRTDFESKENIKPLHEIQNQQQGQSALRVIDLAKLQLPSHQYKKSIKQTLSDPEDSKIKSLWHPGKFYNLTIIAGGKKFKAHKTVLAMQSEVFAQIFQDRSEANEIKLPDFSSKSVEALLKFIYTNEASEEGNAKENFEIANKFKVAAMKTFYEKIICEQIDESNAWETFLFAHRFSSQLIKEKAFRLIVKKIPDDLPDKLMEDPENLKKLLDYRRGYEEILVKVKPLKINLI